MKRNMVKLIAASLACAMMLSACGGGQGGGTATTAANGAAGNGGADATQAKTDQTEASNQASGGEKVVVMAQTGDWDSLWS